MLLPLQALDLDIAGAVLQRSHAQTTATPGSPRGFAAGDYTVAPDAAPQPGRLLLPGTLRTSRSPLAAPAHYSSSLSMMHFSWVSNWRAESSWL